MRPELKLIAGRMYQPGNQRNRGRRRRCSRSSMDSRSAIAFDFRMATGRRRRRYAGNGSRESEVITDVQTVMSAYKLNAFNTLTVMLDEPGSFASFRQSSDSR